MTVLKPGTIEAIQAYDTGTIANAIDRLGLRPATTGFASAEIRCLLPELKPVVGYAVTCREDTITPRGANKTDFEVVYQAIHASPLPAIVVCQDVGPDRWRSCHLGDMMSTFMRLIGAAAFITDGGIRDIAGIKENAPGFQVFGLGMVPGAGESHVVDVGSPVSIGGLEVATGDLLIADVSGIVAIPADSVDEILVEAERVRVRERDGVAFMRSKDFSYEAYLERRRPKK
jgi:4-hydroxy-4-methyl-2-oxoglutarate aldolase